MSNKCAQGLKSGAQIARRVTEEWGARNLYCAACASDSLAATPPNTKAVDFICRGCQAPYQLKAGRGWSESRVPDAAYSAMINAIRTDSAPNLLVMQYSDDWRVRNLLLVPAFFITESVIEARKPLAVTARRAGWVGCNILIRGIAKDGKLRVVTHDAARPRAAVRSEFDAIRALSTLKPVARGWTMDVLAVVRALGKTQFSLSDVYDHDAKLASLHPENHNVRPKIRQQLQVLRDKGILSFDSKGRYSVSGGVSPA